MAARRRMSIRFPSQPLLAATALTSLLCMNGALAQSALPDSISQLSPQALFSEGRAREVEIPAGIADDARNISLFIAASSEIPPPPIVEMLRTDDFRQARTALRRIPIEAVAPRAAPNFEIAAQIPGYIANASFLSAGILEPPPPPPIVEILPTASFEQTQVAALAAAPDIERNAPRAHEDSAPGRNAAVSNLNEVSTQMMLWRARLSADRRKEAAEVAALYAARADAPFFFDEGGWSPAAFAALERLRRASEDALDLSAYPLPDLTLGDADAIARQDGALALAIAAYARQASGGRVDPQRISRLITAQPEVATAEKAIFSVRAAGVRAGEVLAGFNPPDPGYASLRRKLAELRRSAPAANLRIPGGPPLKPGMSDPRVPLVRLRFGLSPQMDQGSDAAIYDTSLATVVASFQRENGLPASGVLTPRTVAVLSGGEPGRLEGAIIANMEMRRWAPRERGGDRIDVNVPAYALTVFHNNAPSHRARVVVGKPNSPTPIFSERMRFIIVNPYWNVPQSIISKEMAPKLAQDPDYFARQGYEVKQKGGKLIVRQPPGERNALGRIKFMFPNAHSVYLHDTPSRALFAANKRAFSHGCVRVDQPFKLAEAILGRQNGWSEARIKSLLGAKERTLDLPEPLPVHLQYFTLVVDERGQLQFYEDIYGYAGRVRQAMGL